MKKEIHSAFKTFHREMLKANKQVHLPVNKVMAQKNIYNRKKYGNRKNDSED